MDMDMDMDMETLLSIYPSPNYYLTFHTTIIMLLSWFTLLDYLIFPNNLPLCYDDPCISS